MEITLQDVSKTIRRATVIDHVSLHLESGHVYGLKGYNGSGKTMLMRLIAGLLHPTEGEVRMDGKTLGKDIDFPPSFGVLLENPAFLAQYTGYENLKLIAALNGTADDTQIRAALERVGLDPEDGRKYRKYSLGMKQRLGIACAIFERPDILLLDEPTNALDADGVELVSQIIREERERGALVILSCHEQARLEALADTIYTIEHGRVVSRSDKESENEA